ncbi:MAG: bifunctional folylpolyglutamate synthase/dihydrofolate synthase, partial [Pedobacter sp.]
MNYQQTLDFLYSKLPMFTRVGASAFKKDLTNTLVLCEAIGNPQHQFKSLHIAGTNGKGSVSAMYHSVFSEFNLKVGLFTSPHLERFTERIKINNSEIEEKEFIDILTNIVIPAIEKIDTVKLDTPTEFEVITITAFYYFYTQNIDVAVIEAGLGGRLD